MGGGGYSQSLRSERATKLGYFDKPREEVFQKRAIDNAMSPKGITVRESRDSDEHPNSVAIILGLDVTASMGHVPHHLVKDGLPHIMGSIIEAGTPDPQMLFLAIGDHLVDRAPLQVGQFESSDELLDKWLTDVWLEQGGGGNGGESYMLAWYFAAKHTAIDQFEKRKKKGYLFTIGDEPVHSEISKHQLEGIMGPGEYQDYTTMTLLDEAKKTYHVYHLLITETGQGTRKENQDGWRELMGDRLIIIDKSDDVASTIAKTISAHEAGHLGEQADRPEEAEPTDNSEEQML
jgi:hypothetical protein